LAFIGKVLFVMFASLALLSACERIPATSSFGNADALRSSERGSHVAYPVIAPRWLGSQALVLAAANMAKTKQEQSPMCGLLVTRWLEPTVHHGWVYRKYLQVIKNNKEYRLARFLLSSLRGRRY
jgi:hypothetical protein